MRCNASAAIGEPVDMNVASEAIIARQTPRPDVVTP
jgi:hypothetical protein